MNLDRFQPPTRAEELAIDRCSQRLESAWLLFSCENALEYYQDGEDEDFNMVVELHLEPAGGIQYGHPTLVNFLAGRSLEDVADEIYFPLRKRFNADFTDNYEPGRF